MANFKQSQPGTDPLSTDAWQYGMAFGGTADVGAMQLAAAQATPSAPTVTAGAAGNPNGAYLYKVVLITGWQQSDGSFWVSGFAPSADSSSITLTNAQGSLSALATGTAGTIGRAIYRTAAGGAAGTEKYVGVVWDNATISFNDNVADANIGTGMPTSSSSPAAYGVAIPASVPTANTTGTSMSGQIDAKTVGGYGYSKTATANTVNVRDANGGSVATYMAPSGLTGATNPSRYVGGTVSGAPTTGTFQVGDFVVDSAGTRWTCTAAGTPGTWTRGSAKINVRVDIFRGYVGSSSTSNYIVLPTNAGVFQFTFHSSEWTNNLFYAEAYTGVANGYTAYAGLYDTTAGAPVAGSEVANSGSSYLTIRSGTFSLVDGHLYVPYMRSSTGSSNAILEALDLLQLL